MSKFEEYLEAASPTTPAGREIDKFILSFQGQISWARKPVNTKDIGQKNKLEIDLLDTDDQDKLVDLLTKLEIYDVLEIWDDEKFSFTRSFDEPNLPNYFILDTPDTTYLINTEGYDYARYVIEIPDFRSFV
jgi:hypothetical protein